MAGCLVMAPPAPIMVIINYSPPEQEYKYLQTCLVIVCSAIDYRDFRL